MASQPPVKRLPPAPSNPVLLAVQAQWLFTEEELSRSPSQREGMSIDTELLHRSKGVNFITQVGIMLKLPQPTLATAAVYLHRFFMRYVMSERPDRPGIHAYPIAATSLFLATKVEENVRRMKELVVACCRVAQKNPNLVVDEQNKEFWKWRDTILHHEDILLEALCFDLQLEQPYRILYEFICYFGVNDNKHVRNSSWAFLNDSMYTVLCLQFPARVIAAAAFYAAINHCDIAFEDDELGRPWWEQIDVDLVDIRRACSRMADLYESNAQHNKHSQYYPSISSSFGEGSEKSRIPRPGGSLEAPDPPSRKRSREPEDGFHYNHTPQDTASPKPGEPSQNGRHSPKRPRVNSEAEYPRSTAGSFEGTAPPPSSSSSFSHDRPPNGHNAQQHHRHPHPLPRTPQTALPPRQNSETQNVDPIQQRIDEIVQKNSATPPKHSSKRVPDSRHREQEDEDPNWKRRSSYSSTAKNEHLPPPPSESRQQPPPPPPEPEPEDEGGGSEEGEL